MDGQFEVLAKEVYENAKTLVAVFLEKHRHDAQARLAIPADFEQAFFRLIDKVNLSLMEDKDNFYGYFLFQMAREIRFDISSPTAVNFKNSKYVIYFNPILFLILNLNQMESSIKHEILHILSQHMIRAKDCKAGYGTLAVNMAMDIVVNTYLEHLPPYATTLEWVNTNYALALLPFESFEYYAEKLQTAIDLLEEDKKAAEDDSHSEKRVETVYDPDKTHAVWEESSEIDEKTLTDFTAKALNQAQTGSIPDYLKNMLSGLKNSKAELPWNVYLKKVMGMIESNKKKIITRRNRRQPDRLDLRGQLRSHKANIVVALDISGSISDEEFNQAMQEVLGIVKTDRHEITIVECDSEIRRVYQIKSTKDLKPRMNIRGNTKFSPVFAYANHNKVNLLVYFTDGKGEEDLLSPPKGYPTLWVISGKGDTLSLKKAPGMIKKLRNIEIKDTILDLRDVPRDGYSMTNQEKIYI